MSESGSSWSLCTPSLVSTGGGGKGCGSAAGKVGSRGSCMVSGAEVDGVEVVSSGVSLGSDGKASEGVGMGVALGAWGVPVCGETLVPGGACGAGRCEPGGAVGSGVTGRTCSGIGWLRSVPGGRVASCCVGLAGGGVG